MHVVLWGQGVMEIPRWITTIQPGPETFGQTMTRLRKARGMSQNDLAVAMYGTKDRQNSISGWEVDRVLPGIGIVKLMARVLDADFNELALRRTEQELRNKERREANSDPLPGPAVAVAEVWYDAVREMLERYGEPEVALRAMREGPTAPLPDHIVQGASELIARGTSSAKCPPPDGTPTPASVKH